jgi:hypothetical protein
MRHAILGAAVILGAATGASALPVAAASADSTTAIRPFSATGCSGFNPEVCISVNGSGLHVNSATVTGYFPSGGDYYLEMWSSSWYYSGAGLSYGPGSSGHLTENPNDNLPNGSGVCGTVTRYGGQRVAEACLTIHN